jgi:signal peptidase I
MVPTLQHGDRLLVLNSMLYDDYKYGDVVVLRKDTFMQEPIVKRVIATEGQVVDIDFLTGEVRVDGVLLDEPYIHTPTDRSEGVEFPVVVEPGHVFVMGDNRGNSLDSRSHEIGQIDKRQILGKAIFLLFPGNNLGQDEIDFSRIGVIG